MTAQRQTETNQRTDSEKRTGPMGLKPPTSSNSMKNGTERSHFRVSATHVNTRAYVVIAWLFPGRTNPLAARPHHRMTGGGMHWGPSRRIPAGSFAALRVVGRGFRPGGNPLWEVELGRAILDDRGGRRLA